jgi:hypothetical protein
MKRHEGEIMNYFEEGHTNAFAESLNNKIQGFVRSNYGIRDRDFLSLPVDEAFFLKSPQPWKKVLTLFILDARNEHDCASNK